MALGQVNYPVLNNYTVTPQDMTDLQTYLQDNIRLLLRNGFNSGVVTGCEVIPGAGFEVTIKAGTIVTPDGRLVVIENDLTVPLDASDSANPRIDRIELEYSLSNDRTGDNEDGVNVVVTRKVVGVASKLAGVAAPNPVAPNKSSAKVSLGIVNIQAAASVIASSAINTSVKYRDSFRFSKVGSQIRVPVLNAQVGFLAIPNLMLDKTKHKQVKVWGDIYREDATQSKTDSISGTLILNKKSGDWISFIDVKGEDSGVELEFDQASESFRYKSSDFNGGAYEGEMIINVEFIER